MKFAATDRHAKTREMTTNPNSPFKVSSVYVYYDISPETNLYTITMGSLCISNFKDITIPFIMNYINPSITVFPTIVLTEENLYYNPKCNIIKDDEIYHITQQFSDGTNIYMQPSYYIPFDRSNPNRKNAYTFEKEFSEEELHTELLYVILQTFIYGTEPHIRALSQLKNAAAAIAV
jgi:hypothetical protein